MLPLHGKTVIEHAMIALNRVAADVRVLVTDRGSYDELLPYTRRCNFSILAGPEDDVLARYALAIRAFGITTVVRATGDNPLVSPLLTRRIVDLHHEKDADYSGFLGIPLGVGVEAIKAESLLEADREATSTYEREHVCPFLYRRPDRYTIYQPYVEESIRFDAIHVTLDTTEDYRFLSSLYYELYHGEPVEISDLIPWLKQFHRSHQYHHVLT